MLVAMYTDQPENNLLKHEVCVQSETRFLKIKVETDVLKRSLENNGIWAQFTDLPQGYPLDKKTLIRNTYSEAKSL